MKITKHIPNLITSLNLFAGSIATYYAFRAEFEITFFALLLAAILDFLDGFAARLLKAYSPLGKELDSLADVISFGMAPGAIAFTLLQQSSYPDWLSFAGFLIPVFSALRLAKFNIDERQTDTFLGMPTPANALFWIGISYTYADLLIERPWLLLIAILFFSLLLVSEIPMLALKFHSFSWKQNSSRYVFLVGCVLLIIVFQLSACWMIILWYILASILFLRAGRRSLS